MRKTYFLGIILIVSISILSQMYQVYGAEEKIVKKEIYYRLDTGVTFLWCNSQGIWQNGLRPGERNQFTRAFQLPCNAKNVEVYKYEAYAEKGENGYFSFGEGSNCLWNRTIAANSKEEYDMRYVPYMPTPYKASGADSYNADTGILTVKYEMTFNAMGGQPYDIKAKLASGEKQEIYELLGSPSQDVSEKMRLIDPKSESYSEKVKGYMYFHPIVITYEIDKFENSNEDGNIDNGEEDTETNGDGEQTDQPQTEEPEKIVDGMAKLSVIPKETYEGHIVKAEDVSTFIVDNKTYNAKKMYDENLASNSIYADSNSGAYSTKISDTISEIMFPRQGEYETHLKIRLKNGEILRDTEMVNIKATPGIQANLSGVQKKNRKQVLNIRVATNPSKPLKRFYVEIEDLETREKVHLENLIGSEDKNENDCSNRIKTREIQVVSKNQYYTDFKLEFLTKNDKAQNYKYIIYAAEKDGGSQNVEKVFNVSTDEPPEAKIEVAHTHYREKDSDIAKISVSDATTNDGDILEREWYVFDEEGQWKEITEVYELEDFSFGKMKNFVHKKKGVGEVKYHLIVREVWHEETLEEYISPEDYLWGEAYGKTDIINMAPVISMEMYAPHNCNILMIARNSEEERQYCEEKNCLIDKLGEENISCNVEIKKINELKISISNESEPVEINNFSTAAYGFYGQDTFLEKEWYMADEECLFTIEATWADTNLTSPYLGKPTQPAYLTAWDIASGHKLWQRVISKEEIDLKKYSKQCGMSKENNKKFIFLKNTEKTNIYDRSTGELITTLPLALGDDNYTSDKWIYSLKEDGLYGINMSNGKIKKVISTKIALRHNYCHKEEYSRYYGKQIEFVGEKDGSLYLYKFDIYTEKYSANLLLQEEGNVGRFFILGLGEDGKIAVLREDENIVYVFDKSCKKIATISDWDSEYGADVSCAFDENGNFNYIVTIRNENKKSSKKSRYRVEAKAYSLISGEILTYYDERTTSRSYGTSGNGTDADRTIYSFVIGNKVILCTGDWTSSVSDGSALSSYYYTSASQILFDFDSKTTSRRMGGSSYYPQFQLEGKISEYGKRTSGYWISSYSWGHAGYTYGDGLNRQRLKVAVMPEKEDSITAKVISENIRLDGTENDVQIIIISEQAEIGEFTRKVIEDSNCVLIYMEKVEAEMNYLVEMILENTRSIEGTQDNKNELTYRKNQKIKYDIIYSDYENDKAKREYWRYTHIPLNDGLHPLSGHILSQSIDSFDIDGKYIVEHWQEDSTGNEKYDKLSNVMEIIFFVEGTGAAPWIEKIKTTPQNVVEGQNYSILVEIDDEEKDALFLETEIYKAGVLIAKDIQNDIIAIDGKYPVISIGNLPVAEVGKYNVICVVRDWDGSGYGEYIFKVLEGGSIKGQVKHTTEWENKKKRYDKDNNGNSSRNYFIPGEKFVLEANVTGKPIKVEAYIEGYTEVNESNHKEFCETLSYQNTLYDKIIGMKSYSYEGELWDKEMASLWKNARMMPLTFVFKAFYDTGFVAIDKVNVVVNSEEGAIRLHRVK